MINVKATTRGSVTKRGHQHHVRFSGEWSSKVNAEHVLAALRAGHLLYKTESPHQSPHNDSKDDSLKQKTTKTSELKIQSQDLKVIISYEFMQVDYETISGNCYIILFHSMYFTNRKLWWRIHSSWCGSTPVSLTQASSSYTLRTHSRLGRTLWCCPNDIRVCTQLK